MSSGDRGAKLRAAAARVVDAVASQGRSLDFALAEHEASLPPDDRALLRHICYGVLRRYWRLTHWAGAMLDRPLKARDSVIKALLLVGLYQLADTRIPDHAAVSATVEAARKLRRPQLAPLVNAILRRALRDRVIDAEPSDDQGLVDHPTWMLDALRADWPDVWRDITAANNERAPMWLRTNARHGSAKDYLVRLRAEGIEAETMAGIPQALRLAEPQPVDQLPGFGEGLVSVQDAAAQLAAPWVLDGIGGRVLDACAAPGGKTGHMLEIGGNNIEVTAIDKDADRLEAVAGNLTRLGLDATLVAADASNPSEWWDGELYDAILLDAPCSASGVIRRHPDIKLLRREADVAALATLQGELLDALWPLLAPGGRLLYATCSVFAAENDAVTGAFIERTRDAREDSVLQNNNIRDLMRDKACGLQILPGTAGMDGFYYASLGKVS